MTMKPPALRPVTPDPAQLPRWLAAVVPECIHPWLGDTLAQLPVVVMTGAYWGIVVYAIEQPRYLTSGEAFLSVLLTTFAWSWMIHADLARCRRIEASE